MNIETARTLVTKADANPAEAATAARASLVGVGEDETLDGAHAIAAWGLGLALRHLRELEEARPGCCAPSTASNRAATTTPVQS